MVDLYAEPEEDDRFVSGFMYKTSAVELRSGTEGYSGDDGIAAPPLPQPPPLPGLPPRATI